MTASLLPGLGWRLSRALRREWQAAGDPAAEGVASFAGRWAFLSLYAALLPAAGAGLGLAAGVAAQREAFVRVGLRLAEDPGGAGAARQLDAMGRRPALRLYRAALRATEDSGGQHENP